MSDFIRNLFSEDFRDIEERIKLAENRERLAREAQREKKIKTVRNLLSMNLLHEKIAKATGVHLSDVEALAAGH